MFNRKCMVDLFAFNKYIVEFRRTSISLGRFYFIKALIGRRITGLNATSKYAYYSLLFNRFNLTINSCFDRLIN